MDNLHNYHYCLWLLGYGTK